MAVAVKNAEMQFPTAIAESVHSVFGTAKTTQRRNAAKLPRIRVPVLILHSRTDDLAGFHHGEKNLVAASEPKFFCELKGGHNDAVWLQTAFREAIEKLLRLVAERTRPGALNGKLKRVGQTGPGGSTHGLCKR